MHSLLHRAVHSPATRGHTLGSPRVYDLVANIAFFGRRRATFVRLIAAAGVARGDHVLDVGCGTGYLVRLLAEVVGQEGSAFGVDASVSMIRYASRKSAASTNCQFRVGVAEALDFRADRFDIVMTSLVMHHLPEDLRVAALQEMRRVLRPGGKLLVAEAQNPSRGLGWQLLARAHGLDRMARAVPDLASLAAHGGFQEIRVGEAPPWLRYVVAVKG